MNEGNKMQREPLGREKKKVMLWIWMPLLILCLFLGRFPVLAATGITAPKGVLANAVGNKVAVSWEPVKGADGYEVYEQSGRGGYAKVRTVASRQVVLPDRKRGITYHYKVRAYCGTASKTKYGAWSRSVETTTAKKGTTTLKNYLTTALAPVGNAMYIWDGGWGDIWEKKGADGAWIGLNPNWRKYADSRKSSYNYRKTRYKYGYGLDCSGYVGWVTYNVTHTKTASSGRGLVMKSTKMASAFAWKGWGTYRKAASVKNFRAGDVMSTSGHVYIVIGQCADGSVVFLHASPPGVQICGTTTRSGGKHSQAIRLARKYMKKYYPSWYRRYPSCSRNSEYLKKYHQFRWDLSGKTVMTDPDHYRSMSPEKILKDLFNEK